MLDIPDDFPNPLVIDAYYHPTVDDSTQRFEWGQPQLDSLRIFLMEAFNWSEEKADQVLLPVLREMSKKKVVHKSSHSQAHVFIRFHPLFYRPLESKVPSILSFIQVVLFLQIRLQRSIQVNECKTLLIDGRNRKGPRLKSNPCYCGYWFHCMTIPNLS